MKTSKKFACHRIFLLFIKNKDFHILLNDSSHNNTPKPYPKNEQEDKKIPKKVLRNESSI